MKMKKLICEMTRYELRNTMKGIESRYGLSETNIATRTDVPPKQRKKFLECMQRLADLASNE